MKKFVFLFLAVVFLTVTMTACGNTGNSPNGNNLIPKATATPKDVIDKTPVKITEVQNDKISKFSKNKNGGVQFKETRTSATTGAKQTVFEDKKYTYSFYNDGGISINDKNASKDIKVTKQTTALDGAVKIALAQAQQIVPVTKGCEYRVIEQKQLNPKIPERTSFFVVLQEFTDKDVFTGSTFIFILSKAGVVLNVNFFKGDAAAALSQTAKITKNQAISSTKDYVFKTYNNTVSKILSSTLVVFKGKLAWEIGFYLTKGNFKYRQRLDAITGDVLYDAIGELRKTRAPGATISPAP